MAATNTPEELEAYRQGRNGSQDHAIRLKEATHTPASALYGMSQNETQGGDNEAEHGIYVKRFL